MKVIFKLVKAIPFLILGLLVGITGTLSFLRTDWETYEVDFFFWASIVSTIFAFLSIIYSVWQYRKVESEKQKGDAQVKIWMQDANGIYQGLQTLAVNCLNTTTPAIGTNKFSSITDVGVALYSFASSAKALYQSLYEERCVTEDIYRKRQNDIGEAMHKQTLKSLEEKARPTATTATQQQDVIPEEDS